LGKYKTILIDPPWEISFDLPWGQGKKKQYETMKLKDIKNLPIGSLAADECNLFLWTTHTYLEQALNLMKVWGFKFHVCITWDKGKGLVVNGFNRRTELCLFGYKKKLNIDPKGQSIPTIFQEMPDLFSDPSTFHSKKPEKFYRLIERNSPPPYLELFARSKKAGWDVWGNEVESDIKLDLAI